MVFSSIIGYSSSCACSVNCENVFPVIIKKKRLHLSFTSLDMVNYRLDARCQYFFLLCYELHEEVRSSYSTIFPVWHVSFSIIYFHLTFIPSRSVFTLSYAYLIKTGDSMLQRRKGRKCSGTITTKSLLVRLSTVQIIARRPWYAMRNAHIQHPCKLYMVTPELLE